MGFVDEPRASYYTTGHLGMGNNTIVANKMTIKSPWGYKATVDSEELEKLFTYSTTRYVTGGE